MVIGSGLLARAFSPYEEDASICIFASGVSDSVADDETAFERERDLAMEHIGDSDRLFVYFSTTSLTDEAVADRAYVRHKSAMEELVAAHARRHLICRLPYVVGAGGNPNTIVNHLLSHVKSGAHFQLWENAERNFLDVDDVYLTVKGMVDAGIRTGVHILANPNSMAMTDVVQQIEEHLGRTGNFDSLAKGAPLHFNTKTVTTYHPQPERLARADYFRGLLQKYHEQQA